MAAQMQMSSMQDMQKGEPCEHCAKTADKQQKKNGCCGDMACAANCASTSHASITFFGMQSIPLSFVGSTTERFYGSDRVLASHPLNTQDRPPKHLS
ncbi:MAG: hypothetical protein JSS02_35410 [Planctomycetes bacterium]|nr:hypothetical protein [Planctomycetota bacterium]